jgi:hypothetical protein
LSPRLSVAWGTLMPSGAVAPSGVVVSLADGAVACVRGFFVVVAVGVMVVVTLCLLEGSVTGAL